MEKIHKKTLKPKIANLESNKAEPKPVSPLKKAQTIVVTKTPEALQKSSTIKPKLTKQPSIVASAKPAQTVKKVQTQVHKTKPTLISNTGITSP